MEPTQKWMRHFINMLFSIKKYAYMYGFDDKLEY